MLEADNQFGKFEFRPLEPCVCGGRAKAKLITRRPIEANTQELEENRRSRSAHLRVLEKI